MATSDSTKNDTDKTATENKTTPKRTKSKDGAEPTVEQARELLNPDPVEVEEQVVKNPPEAGENHADWSNYDPQDVIEIEGQRETVESKLARGGPQQTAATTVKPSP